MVLKDELEKIYEKCSKMMGGEVASYIPELANVDPNQLSISLVTVDGQIEEIGDVNSQFTIQSICKPFSYAKCLEYFKPEELLSRVGVEPTGEDFNSISKLDHMRRPMNPMVNAGAISLCGMLQARLENKSEKTMLEYFSDFVGREVKIDSTIFESEWRTTDRNRAITYLLKNYDMLSASVQESLELYVKLCSISMTSTDLANMGATLANRGLNPITQKQCVPPQNLSAISSVMLTCGMYNYSGQWVFDVGLPAKSGVSGAVLMIVPDVMGIAIYSPRLDARGNSVRGIEACRELSKIFNLHIFDFHAPRRVSELLQGKNS